MDRLARLADIQDCVELVYRLARGLDRTDAALMASVFHPDATDDHGLFKGSATDFIAFSLKMLDTMARTQHVIGQVLVEVNGDEARGESYFVAYHTILKPEGNRFLVAAGRYLDRFERREGVWKIAHRGAVWDWNSVGPLTDYSDRSQPGAHTYGARGETDASYAHFAEVTSAAFEPAEGDAHATRGRAA